MAYIPEKFKAEVHAAARARCEYCLIGEPFLSKPHEFDHIIAIQHGGQTASDNICLACMDCNRGKGPNLCSLDPSNGEIVRLFDPRHQQWEDHFQLQGAWIHPTTAVGRATARVLDLNSQRQVARREMLRTSNLYPDFEAS